MRKGYAVLFVDNECSITHKVSGVCVAKVKMGNNNMFILNAATNSINRQESQVDQLTRLWHLRYGHLHSKGLKVLKSRNMVQGLPVTKDLGV
jgi:hypothetical protein